MSTKLNRLFRLYAMQRGRLPEDIQKLLIPSVESNAISRVDDSNWKVRPIREAVLFCGHTGKFSRSNWRMLEDTEKRMIWDGFQTCGRCGRRSKLTYITKVVSGPGLSKRKTSSH